MSLALQTLVKVTSWVTGITLSAVERVKRLGFGAVIGTVLGIGLVIIHPAWLPNWSHTGIIAAGTIVGLLIEGSTERLLGWYVRPKMERAEIERRSELKFDRVHEFEERGLMASEEAHRWNIEITRLDLNDGKQVRRRIGAPSPDSKPRPP